MPRLNKGNIDIAQPTIVARQQTMLATGAAKLTKPLVASPVETVADGFSDIMGPVVGMASKVLKSKALESAGTETMGSTRASLEALKEMLKSGEVGKNR
ncbi:MAG TPA: hypothetical protein VK171_07105 [Fimbriimonas sp.]|nr:hypothetical protein [Fimbriimonas sp.]